MWSNIILANKAEPTMLAAEELSKYLMLYTRVPIQIDNVGSSPIVLGLFSDIEKAHGENTEELDHYEINVCGKGGFIAGSNERSILFGVYRFLFELGFRWVRPGKDGEIIPKFNSSCPVVQLSDQASYRHRGVCIEGAVSSENIFEMIEWLPKLGFNGYFIQFSDVFAFLERWYKHLNNPLLTPEAITPADSARITAAVRQAIRQRGMDLHMVGHGWTCEPFGIPGPGWVKHNEIVPPEISQYFAQINGKRELFGDIALNTNLCYSNAEVRRIITDAIVDWAEKNPDANVIHFWLADGSNNQCECEACRKKRPSDWYITMLNELDKKLTQRNLPVKIVFLIYVDLLWPPETEKIFNQDRFILMFAPITRSYTKAFVADDVAEDIPGYERNKLKFPGEPEKNLAFLQRWQEIFGGSSFDFDYHYMWDHHKECGYYSMAQVLHDDCANLKNLGLDGLVSCQNQRVFFPNGLGMTVMGRTLWNRDMAFDEICSDYFRSAFGDGSKAARQYFAKISELIPARLLRFEGTPEEKIETASEFYKLKDIIAEIKPFIQEGLTQSEVAWVKSWQMLQLHTEYVVLFADLWKAFWVEGKDEALPYARKLFEWVRSHEMTLQGELDVFEYVEAIGGYLYYPPEAKL